MTTIREGSLMMSVRHGYSERDEFPSIVQSGIVRTNGFSKGPAPKINFTSASQPAIEVQSWSGRGTLDSTKAQAEGSQTASAFPEWIATKHQDPRRATRYISAKTASHSSPRYRLATTDQTHKAVGVAVVGMVIVLLLGGIWGFTNVGYAENQSATSWNVSVPLGAGAATPTPAVSEIASASSTPSKSQSTTPEVTLTPDAAMTPVHPVLRANAIYGATITGACPAQSVPTSPEQARTALTAYKDCMNDVWSKTVVSGGYRFKAANIRYFVNTYVSACGTMRSSDPMTATYCSKDSTIYVSPNGVTAAIGSRFLGAELIATEYAHHVQSLTQILTRAAQQGWSQAESSRRIQLQAHCLAFAVISHVDGFEPDTDAFRASWTAEPVDTTYGSVAAVQRWGEKGLAAQKVGDCDTYSVASVTVA